MAIIEVSEDGVRRAVGGEVFGQAKEWVDKVSGLRAGGPVISATVAGVPVSVRIRPDRIAGECECPAHGLCAHAVAAVLAWVRAGTDADEPDLFEVLRMQDPDWLATRLAELAAADPSLAERLLAEAEDGQALEDVAGLRAELDEVLDELEDEASSLGLHDEWYPDGEALDELLDEAAEFVPDAPDAVRELADHVITRTERLLNYENCYGEGITKRWRRRKTCTWPPARRARPTWRHWPSAWGQARWKADGDCSVMAPPSTPACSVRPGWPGTVSC